VVLGGGYVNTELRQLTDPRVFDFCDYITMDDGERPLLALIEHLRDPRAALRQVSNTPRPYIDTMSDDEEFEVAPKIRRMADNLRAAKEKDKNFRAYVYSNYLGGGLHPYSRALDRAGIKYNLFTGETAPKDRARIIQEYNDGIAPVILASGAGSEGLDLRGTKLVQLMEPHWNDARLEQAIGRGIRYKSHAHLPEDERKVRVEKYYSVFPDTLATKLRLKKKDRAVEQYMREMSDVKGQLARQIMQAMQEASDKGTSQIAAIAKARAEAEARAAEAAQSMPKAASWLDVLADYPT
jgi:superfamily II DNA or RNA helicase